MGTFGSWLPQVAVAQGRARGRYQKSDQQLLEQIHSDLVTHESFGDKFAGGPGDNANADWIAGRLRSAGYDVVEQKFEAPYFVPRTARLSTGIIATDVTPQPVVVTTGAEGLRAPLALYEDGEVGDVDLGNVAGRIVLFMAPFARHAALNPARGIGKTVKDLEAAGAAAIVIVTNGPSGEAVGLNVPTKPFADIPLALMAPHDVHPFLKPAREGAEAWLIQDGDAITRTNRNIIGTLKRGKDWICISTPRSGWHTCVAERGTGTAAFLELAEWAAGTYPDLSVFLMNNGAHEYNFAGSHHALELAPPAEDTLVWCHIGATLAARDAVEERDETGDGFTLLDRADAGRSLMVTDSARAAATEAFHGLVGLENPGTVRPGAGELSSFTDRGVKTAFAVIGLHRWFHTIKDTIDTTSAELLLPVVKAHRGDDRETGGVGR